MSTNVSPEVKADASIDKFPLADDAISRTTVKRARWENLQTAACPDTNHINVCNYSHPIEEKAAHTHTVTIENGRPVRCTCKAFEYNEGLCKHCLACANTPKAMAKAAEQTDETDTATTTTTFVGPYAGYPFSEGDHVTVDWTEGQGPQDEISGIVDAIDSFRGYLRHEEIVISVTDYDDPAWQPYGRTYDCAPEWITVVDD